MKQIFILFAVIAFSQVMLAQKLSLELNPGSEAVELGKKVWYNLVLTNDTDETMKLFLSPLSQYKLGGYEYTISFNGSPIVERSTWPDDSNSRYRENRIKNLYTGESRTLLGLSQFTIKEKGVYEIELTYYQDASNMNKKWAKNGKAKKLASNITTYRANLKETIVIE